MHAPTVRPPILTALLIASATSTAAAQSLFAQHGEIVLASGHQAPGLLPGYTIRGSSTQFDPPVMDQNGVILFRGQFEDTGGVGGLTTSNDRALFLGRTGNDIGVAVRADDPAPGIPGATLRGFSTTAGSGTFAQGGCYRISPFAEVLFFRSNIFDSATPGNTPNNSDECLFWGPIGSMQLVCREGTEVPFYGAGSGVLWGTMSSSNWMTQHQMNGNGLITISNVMTGVPANTESVLATGVPGSLQVISREGDVMAAGGLLAGGEVVTVASGSFLAAEVTINEAGQVLHDMKFSTAAPSTATAANDLALALWTAGTDVVIAREGQQAPGFPAGVLWASPSNGWSVWAADGILTKAGNTFLLAQLNGGGITMNVDDFALYVGGQAGWTMVAQRSVTPAPASLGAGVTYNQFSNSTMTMSESGVVAFTCQLNGTPGGANDNTALIYGTPGNLLSLGQEGGPVVATGLAGGPWFYRDLYNTSFPRMNDRGHLFWTPAIWDGVNTASIKTVGLAYDPNLGLSCIYDLTESVAAPLGVSTIASTQTNGFNSSGDGGVSHMNNNGDWTVKMSLTPSANGAVIARGHIGTLVGKPSSVPVGGGVPYEMHLDVGPAYGNQFYFILASGLGTRPGFPHPLNFALNVPLNYDSTWTVVSQAWVNTALWTNTLWVTDANGTPLGNPPISFNMPAGFPGFLGTTLHHAAILFDGALVGTFATEPISVRLY